MGRKILTGNIKNQKKLLRSGVSSLASQVCAVASELFFS
jgi:hypothetical protein